MDPGADTIKDPGSQNTNQLNQPNAEEQQLLTDTKQSTGNNDENGVTYSVDKKAGNIDNLLVEVADDDDIVEVEELGEPTPAPENCWGWLVVASCCFLQIIAVGLPFSVGVYYVEWLDTFQMGHAATAWIGSINCGLLFGAGPLAGLMCNKYGHRVTAFVGIILAAAGQFISAFSKSIYSMYVAYGIISGLGFSMIFLAAIGIVGLYFDKRRPIALGISLTGAGAGGTVIPVLVQLLISHLGWRGAMILTSGLTIQMLVFAALLIPVEFWSKKPSISSRCCIEWKLSKSQTDISKMCDATLLRDPKLIVIMLNKFMWNFGSLIIFVLIVDFASSHSISNETSAWIISIGALANAIGRFSAGVIGQIPVPHLSLIVFILCNILCGVCFMLMPVNPTFQFILLFMFFYGLFLGVVIGLIAVLTASIFGAKKLTSAYGFQNLGDGVGALIGAPIGGWLFDMTGRYDIPFYFGGMVTILAIVPMLLMPLLQRSSHTNNQNIKYKPPKGEQTKDDVKAL